ncbi:MAG: CPBP family glutamic-type intramembrane protease [Candidatus Bathyarchaeota archaeon]
MFDSLRIFLKMFLIIAVFFTIFSYLFAIVLGPLIFYFTPQGLTTGTIHLSSLPIWFFTISADIPIGLNLNVVFFIIWSIFILSFIAAYRFNENFHKIIKGNIFQPTRKLFNNCLFSMPVINSMTLIAVITIQSFQEAGGIPTGTSPVSGSDPLLALVDLSYSAVIEEIGFRVIPIGIFFVFFFFVFRRLGTNFSLKNKLKLFFSSILFPDQAKKMVGDKTVNEYGIIKGISLSEWGLIIFTSIIFGLAHFDPGNSWEIGKITTATFTGFVIGLSYLLYGVQASLILHWFFNTYTKTYLVFSDLYPAMTPFSNAVWIFSIILGIIGWVTAGILFYIKLVKSTKKREIDKQNIFDSNLPISLQ